MKSSCNYVFTVRAPIYTVRTKTLEISFRLLYNAQYKDTVHNHRVKGGRDYDSNEKKITDYSCSCIGV